MLKQPLLDFVGTTRFELATTRPPDVYSTGLSYVPNFYVVGATGFEPATSALSKRRSKPAELNTLLSMVGAANLERFEIKSIDRTVICGLVPLFMTLRDFFWGISFFRWIRPKISCPYRSKSSLAVNNSQGR